MKNVALLLLPCALAFNGPAWPRTHSGLAFAAEGTGRGGAPPSAARLPVLSASPSSSVEPSPSLATSDVLSLDVLRSALARQEETIIFALIERAQFARNPALYARPCVCVVISIIVVPIIGY